MADEKEIKLKFTIDTADTAKSVSDVRKAIKDLTSEVLAAGDEGGEGIDKLNQKIGQLKEKLNDASEVTNAYRGTAVEKLRASWKLLTDGFQNFNFQKIGSGFKVLGSAMKALPIFALIGAVTYLIENFDKLSEKFKFLGDTVKFVTGLFNKLTDAIGLTNTKLDEQTTKILENNKKILESQGKKYDNEIALLKASGKETEMVELQKQEYIKATTQTSINALENKKKINGELTKDELKTLDELKQQKVQAQADEDVILAKGIKDAKDKKDKANKEAADKKKAADEKEDKDRIDRANALNKSNEQLAKEGEARNLSDLEIRKQNEIAAEDHSKQELIALDIKYLQEKALLYSDDVAKQAEINTQLATANAQLEQQKRDDAAATAESVAKQTEDRLAREAAAEQKAIQQKRELEDMAIQSSQALSDTVFSIASIGRSKNSKEELAAAKTQFGINKALQLTSAVITGRRAVLDAYANGMKNPVPLLGPATGIIYAAVAAATSAANIAKIAAVKFDSGASGSGGGASGGAGGSTPTPPTPRDTFTPVGLQKIGGSGGTGFANPTPPTPAMIDKDKQAQKVYVVSQDISSSQNKDAVLERRASFSK